MKNIIKEINQVVKTIDPAKMKTEKLNQSMRRKTHKRIEKTRHPDKAHFLKIVKI